MVGCASQSSMYPPPPHNQNPQKVTYRNFKNFDESTFKEQVKYIPFHVSNIFDDVNDQYWARSWRFKDVLDEHAPKD